MKSASQPVSLRLDPQLMRKAAVFAKQRKVGLSTALRMIISEHLDAAEAAAELGAALRWQRDQAWAALDHWERGGGEELSLQDIQGAHAKAMGQKRGR
jgi:hypothetical protein